MEPLPLVPLKSPRENPDTLHVLREAFQGFITQDDFPRNLSTIIQKQNIPDKYIKQVGENACRMFNEEEKQLQEIYKAEENIMTGHAKLLIAKDYIDKNKCLLERLKLKRINLLPKLDDEDVNKFPVLRKEDLFPNKIKRCIDFRFHLNECQYICEPIRKKCLEKPKSKIVKNKNIFPSLIENKRGALFRPTHFQDTLGKSYCASKKASLKLPDIEKKKPTTCNTLFAAFPENIVFYDYKINVVYEKKLKIQNISSTMQAFFPKGLPKDSHFHFELVSQSLRVAPGMYAYFKVTFQTDMYQDEQETLTFGTYKGCDVKINLVSFRNSPCLQAYIYRIMDDYYNRCYSPLPLAKDFNTARAAALNSTIDCGSCLLGSATIINIILHNEGEMGSFFLMSEEDWYHHNVEDINNYMVLHTPSSFQIYPSYFKIEKYELVELNVVFCPLSNGLLTEKLFVLCNNTSVQEIEIIGDGISFEEDLIKFEVPEKLTNFSLFMDEESTYYFRFGEILPYTVQIRKFLVRNLSSLNLQFRWQFRKSSNATPFTVLERIKKDWIEIQPQEGLLQPDEAHEFQIKVFAKTFNEGCYSAVLSFYVLNIPESSLRSNWNFPIIEKEIVQHGPYCVQYVDVLRAEIETVFNVVPLSLVIVPYPYTSPVVLGYNEMHKHEIMLYTEGKFPLQCRWTTVDERVEKIPEMCSTICPKTFTVTPNEVATCELTILVKFHKNIDEKHILLINGGFFKKEYQVFVNVGRPNVEFSKNLINFGSVIIGKVFKEQLKVINLGCTEVHWKIMEYKYDTLRKRVVKLKKLPHLSQTEGFLKAKSDSVKITYSMSRGEELMWLSFLVLLISIDKGVTITSTCFVTYEVTSPHLIIHSSTSEGSLICPSNILYLHKTSKYPICLHNDGSVPATFVWGAPYGKDIQLLRVEYFPRWGWIPPESCVHVKFSITVFQSGIYKVTVPCFVGKIRQPLLLKIIINSSNIFVYIHLPEFNGTYKQVLWPVKYLDYDYEVLGECICIPQAILDQCAGGKNYFNEDETIENTSEIFKPVNIDPFSHYDKYQESEEITAPPLPCTPVTSSDTTEMEQDFYPMSRTQLREIFGQNVVLRDHIVELKMVPHRELFQTSIKVQNLTPIVGNVTVKTVNFFPVKPEDELRKDDVLGHLKLISFNKWEELMGKDFGIVVRAEPTIVKLEENSIYEIDLFVYADTWGTYLEEVVIEINDVMPFCFTLIIEIVGFPLEFPMTLNSIKKNPVIRFGTVSCSTDIEDKHLKVNNKSSIPVMIKWHTFQTPCKNEKLPFNVIFDLFSTDNEINQGQLQITSKYYGIEISNKFKIDPWELQISPKSTETLNIKLNHDNFNYFDVNEELDYWLVGFLYADDKHAFVPNLCRRKSGVELHPAKFKLQAVIEMPCLKYQNTYDEIKFTFYATEVMDSNIKIIYRRLLFRNIKRCEFVITNIKLKKPFYLYKVESEFGRSINSNDLHIVVPSNSCVEVVVKCIITRETILKCIKNSEEKPNEVKFAHYLTVFQNDFEQQVAPLMVEILYPQMKVVPTEINFGSIFIGDTSKKIVTVLNSRAHTLSVHIVSIKEDNCGVFMVLPREAIVRKATSGGDAFTIFNVFFTPRERKEYRDTFEILTRLPNYRETITLSGNGVWDERYHVEGKN